MSSTDLALERSGLPACITGDTLSGMSHVTVRDLRNHGGQVLERVARGESLTVTLDGRPVAELRPLPGRTVPAAVLLDRWRGLPRVDIAEFRADLDRVLGSDL